MPTDATSPTIRVRLSNQLDAAVEFSAQDGRTLAAGCARAFARYVAQHGATQFGHPVRLALQVRPTVGDPHGWVCPIRGATPVEVFVSAELLDRRPPDDWTNLWEWVVAARAHDDALGQFMRDVRADTAHGLDLPPAEDDRDGR